MYKCQSCGATYDKEGECCGMPTLECKNPCDCGECEVEKPGEEK